MSKLIPYRFTVIRFVPDSFRDESSNIGLFFQCEEKGIVHCRFEREHPRFKNVTTPISSLVIQVLGEFQKQIDTGNDTQYKGDIKKIDYIQHLIKTHNGLIRFSELRTGLCEYPEVEFDRLYRRLVQQ